MAKSYEQVRYELSDEKINELLDIITKTKGLNDLYAIGRSISIEVAAASQKVLIERILDSKDISLNHKIALFYALPDVLLGLIPEVNKGILKYTSLAQEAHQDMLLKILSYIIHDQQKLNFALSKVNDQEVIKRFINKYHYYPSIQIIVAQALVNKRLAKSSFFDHECWNSLIQNLDNRPKYLKQLAGIANANDGVWEKYIDGIRKHVGALSSFRTYVKQFRLINHALGFCDNQKQMEYTLRFFSGRQIFRIGKNTSDPLLVSACLLRLKSLNPRLYTSLKNYAQKNGLGYLDQQFPHERVAELIQTGKPSVGNVRSALLGNIPGRGQDETPSEAIDAQQTGIDSVAGNTPVARPDSQRPSGKDSFER